MTPLRHAIVATGVVALIAAPIWTRELTAAASTSIPSTDARALSLRIVELERRIAELEVATDGVGRAANGRTLAPIVRAPFVVVDEKNRVLMSVDRSPTGAPRLSVGNPDAAEAVLGATDEGGVLQLKDATNKTRLLATASATRTGITTTLRAGKNFMGENDDGLPVFQARNPGGIPVAELKAVLAQNGQLVLTNQAGDRLVVAGVSTKGVGIIKMGPGGNGPAAVMGNIALPASEIQGKKN